MRRAAFIGRFQPFHNGHLKSVEYILGVYDEVVIVIAAAQYSYTLDNPFTAGERIEMVKRGLGELYNRVYIVPVDNIPSNFEWPRHVLNYIPRVERVFSNNRFVRMLFENYGLETGTTPVVEGVSGSIVRKLMAEGGDWKRLVPSGVAEFIEEVNGVERVRSLYNLGISMRGERFEG
ncbi:nicotinamide-nucleotide adenylyltransferase [Thermogladius sp. 4427co]|uniref:nicotinamide-nucleotide adenylyltransferase n=1 Tax=Thermogladius sp. 4427co TaxID=3450718 RepID=UPI003F78C533